MDPPASLGASRQVSSCRHGTMVYPRHDQHVGRSLALYGEWAEAEMDLLGLLIKPGDAVIDVGANIGTHTLFFSEKVGPTGRVLACEPQRLAIQMLCANLALNHRDNVIALPVAVGQSSGTVAVPALDYQTPANFGGARLSLADVSGVPTLAADTEPATLVTLDQLARTHLRPARRRCRLIKIDVEGMERAVLEGGEQLINDDEPYLYVENNDRQRSPLLIEWLEQHDYRLFWHVSRFFNPRNFRQNPDNVFGALCDLNMIAVRPNLAAAFGSLAPVRGPGDPGPSSVERPDG
ncbi:MAG TPA: FkbM family methyltransferase [Polyangia bacterium]|nr:FkbM family methyltransferase [Polyangia bacterium]